MNLHDVLAGLTGDGPEGWTVEPPESWRQGRTLYGGLNAALCARASRLAAGAQGDPGPLRSLQVAFLAPSAGRVRYTPEVLRRGRSTTFVGVDCHAEAGLSARAILTFGQARESELRHDRLPAPAVPAPEASHPFGGVEGAPSFLEHLELRFAGGGAPFSGADEPTFAMWVRHRDPSGLDPELALLAIADVLPPAASASYSTMRPVSSVTWTVDLAPPPPEPDAWYLLHTASEQAADGYSLQAMSCFAADGRLRAVGRQTVAVF